MWHIQGVVSQPGRRNRGESQKDRPPVSPSELGKRSIGKLLLPFAYRLYPFGVAGMISPGQQAKAALQQNIHYTGAQPPENSKRLFRLFFRWVFVDDGIVTGRCGGAASPLRCRQPEGKRFSSSSLHQTEIEMLLEQTIVVDLGCHCGDKGMDTSCRR